MYIAQRTVARVGTLIAKVGTLNFVAHVHTCSDLPGGVIGSSLSRHQGGSMAHAKPRCTECGLVLAEARDKL